MLKIVVVDRSAESRNRIVAEVNHLLAAQVPGVEYLPRFSIKALAIQELKFNTAPDICIVGPEVLSVELSELARIKKLIPQSAMLVRLNTVLAANIASIDHIARFGADDFFEDNIPALDFVRKLVMLSKRSRTARTSKLIAIDSGKGGSGVTSVTAALAECLLSHDQSVVMLDLDFETQDLSRFIQARPYINENLQLIYDHNRPLTQEFIEQCLVQVWHDEPALQCMPPCAETDAFYDARATHARTLVGILEILDEMFDVIVVDCGGMRGSFLRTIHRAADGIVFILQNDPAGIYASVDRINKIQSIISPDAKLIVLENRAIRQGVHTDLLKNEFLSATKLTEENWLPQPLVHCNRAARWPGSGGTLFSEGKREICKTITALADSLGLISAPQVYEQKTSIFESMKGQIGKFAKLIKNEKSTAEKYNLSSNEEIGQIKISDRSSAKTIVLGQSAAGQLLAEPDDTLVSKITLPLTAQGAEKDKLEVARIEYKQGNNLEPARNTSKVSEDLDISQFISAEEFSDIIN